MLLVLNYFLEAKTGACKYLDYIQIEKDKIRDKFPEGLGLTVLRFENRLVFKDPEYILKEIRNAFKGEDKCS